MSSSESEDENLKQFAAAVDTSLFNNEFYKPEKEKTKKQEKIELKSQRHLDNTENIFQSELNVSDNMKEFIGKKMSKLIEDSVQFVDMKPMKIPEKDVNSLKLLKGCKEYVTLDQPDLQDYPKCKVPIKRRAVEESPKESVKIKSSVTDIATVAQEVDLWHDKNRHKELNYRKGTDGVCHQVEEPNEFSKSRNKNKWNETKIKDAKYFNKGLHNLIKRSW